VNLTLVNLLPFAKFIKKDYRFDQIENRAGTFCKQFIKTFINVLKLL